MKQSVLFISLFSLLLLSSCKDDKTENSSDDNAVIPTAQTMKDVSYGSDYKQRFDIYLPANRSSAKTPVLFLIHGGGWSSGDKNDYTASIPALQTMFPTYAFVTVGYRLYNAGNNKFPNQEEDVKACINYVLNHNKEYHISQNFALLGGSAGAHLAMLYAYKYGDSDFKPKAVVDMVGPTELMLMYRDLGSSPVKQILVDVAGNPATNDSLLYKSSSPLNYVKAGSPPTLMLHGTADTVVPYTQALYLRDRLMRYNVDYACKIYPGEGHGLEGAGPDALGQIQAFLSLRLK